MDDRERRRMDLALAGFVEAMESWNWSKRSLPSYEHGVRVFLDWLAEETDVINLAEVTPEIMSAYQVALLTIEKKDGTPLATVTQRTRLGVVKRWFEYLAAEGKLLTNPAEGLSLPKRRQSLPQALLTPDEAIHMIESIDTSTVLGLRDRAVVEVLYACGIRNAELRSLQVRDYDPESETLSIRAGKGNRDRVVPIGPVAATVLSEYLVQARPQLVKKRGVPNLYLTRNGNPMDALSVINAVRRAAKNARIEKDVKPHGLRHCCATHLLQGGADIRHIQRLLGHESIRSVMIYTRVEISDLQAIHRRFHPRERKR